LELLYQKPIEEWDFEELQRGRPRKPNGRFSKNKPAWLTPVMMIEAQRRLEQMSHEELSRYAGNAVEVMAELMNHSRVDLVRYNAAKYVLDHVVGMPVQRLKVEANVKFEGMLADVMVNHDGKTTGEVIDLDESEWEEGELGARD
jgi:phosphorylcholine metabolism protein LicD